MESSFGSVIGLPVELRKTSTLVCLIVDAFLSYVCSRSVLWDLYRVIDVRENPLALCRYLFEYGAVDVQKDESCANMGFGITVEQRLETG